MLHLTKNDVEKKDTRITFCGKVLLRWRVSIGIIFKRQSLETFCRVKEVRIDFIESLL